MRIESGVWTIKRKIHLMVNISVCDMNIPESELPGSYIILFKLTKPSKVKIGKLGVYDFHKGYYTYTGSAMNGLKGRIERHLNSKKKLHWHIDYLLGNPKVRIEKIYAFPCSIKRECQINQKLKSKSGNQILIPGFGSSDCKSNCKSHLLYWSQNPPHIKICNLQ